jgi:capsular exopolysaccharide synthesis family protein
VSAPPQPETVWIDTYLEDQQSEILRYLRIVLKRKWLVLAVAVLVFGAVATNTYSTDPVYTSSVNIQIDPEQNILPYKAYAAIEPDPRYLGTQAQVIRSEALARRAVLRLELTKDHEKATQLARWFAGNVTVALVEGTQVVKVTYRSDDPEFAARAVNGLADEYITFGFETKRDASAVAQTFLQEELTKVQQTLQRSEQRLVDYGRQHNILLPSRDNNVVMRKLTELNDEMTRVEAQVRTMQYDTLQHTPLENFPEKLRTPVTRELDSRRSDLEQKLATATMKFGAQWPEVVTLTQQLEQVRGQLEAEKQKALQQAAVEYGLAVAHRDRLAEALRTQHQLADRLTQASIGYDLLKREADSDRQIHDGLLQRLRETDVSAGLKSVNVHVIDRGHVPRLPTSPNIPLSLGLGLVFGLIGGVVAATAVELFDRKLKTAEDVERELHLPFLGAIPAFTKAWTHAGDGLLVAMHGGASSPGLIPHAAGSTHYWESYRAVRTSLLFSPATRPRTLLITSALPGEGKSTTAVNLAITFAQTGARTLLVELDMRRPQLAARLALDPGLGMSRYLAGQTNFYSEIQETAAPNLFVVAAGPIPPNPPELIGSPRMARAIALTRRHFEYVIIDGPPVLSLTDALVVASQVEGVVLVVHGRTPTDMAQKARTLLKSVDAKLLGVLINNVKMDAPPDYYADYVPPHTDIASRAS